MWKSVDLLGTCECKKVVSSSTRCTMGQKQGKSGLYSIGRPCHCLPGIRRFSFLGCTDFHAFSCRTKQEKNYSFFLTSFLTRSRLAKDWRKPKLFSCSVGEMICNVLVMRFTCPFMIKPSNYEIFQLPFTCIIISDIKLPTACFKTACSGSLCDS